MFFNKTQLRKHNMSHVKMNILLNPQNHANRLGNIYPVKSMRYAST